MRTAHFIGISDPISIEQARVLADAAIETYMREDAPAHMLLVALPPGCGKTRLGKTMTTDSEHWTETRSSGTVYSVGSGRVLVAGDEHIVTISGLPAGRYGKRPLVCIERQDLDDLIAALETIRASAS